MLSWILINGPAAIACEIDANADRSFDVRVEPLSMPGAGVIEHFNTATAALEWHAEVSEQLRDAGWHSTDHLLARRCAS